MASVLDVIVKGKDDGASAVFDKLGGALTKLAGIAAGVVAGGIAAIGAGLISSVGAAMEAQDGLAELEAVIKSTGGAAGITAAEAQELASSFQSITRFSDDAILAGESMLLTFTNIGEEVFPLATEAMLSMAQKFGSVEAASVQLGKALNDPVEGVTALRRVGVMLTDTQEEQIARFMELGDVAGAQKVILDELGVEFGGLAAAAGATAAGGIDIFWNKLGDIQEQIGGAVLPAITLLTSKLSEGLDSAAFQAALAAIITGLTDVSTIIMDLVQGNTMLALQDFQALLLKIGFSPEQVSGISEDISSIVEDSGRIGEAFGKIFSSENVEGASAFATVVDGIAWSMERIASAAETAGQLREIFEQLGGAGGVDAIVNEATGTNMNPIQNIAAADQFLRSDAMSQQGMMGGAFGSAATPEAISGNLAAANEAIGAGLANLANAIMGMPPPVVNVALDSAPIAATVSQSVGARVQQIRRAGASGNF